MTISRIKILISKKIAYFILQKKYSFLLEEIFMKINQLFDTLNLL
jgi:hypothetical protein